MKKILKKTVITGYLLFGLALSVVVFPKAKAVSYTQAPLNGKLQAGEVTPLIFPGAKPTDFTF